MRTKTLMTLVAFAVVGLFVAAGPVHAGTKYQTTLVPDVAGTNPGFSASGSSIKIMGNLSVKGKLKKVTDGTGALVTTDPLTPGDEYSVEIDLSVPHTGVSGTVELAFDLVNGNGKFSAASLSADPALAGAATGDGVAVLAIRVKDSAGAVIGRGGFAMNQ